MGGSTRQVVGISVLCFLVAFLAFALYSITAFEPKLVLPVLIWRWVWNQSLIFFIEALVPLQSTALLLYYSLANPARRRKRQTDLYAPFYRMVNGVLVVLLLFTLGYAVLSEAVRPVLYAKRSEMLDLTSLARLYYGNYRSFVQKSDYRQAERYLSLYLQINPSDAVAQRQLDQVKLDAVDTHLRASSAQAASPSAAPSATRYENESAQGLVSIAESYLEKRDFASAHYYASLSLALSPNDAKARQISEQSLRDLSRITTSPTQQAQQYFFSLKSEGQKELAAGNAFDAYYLFRSLSATHPNDPDVVAYLRRATEELKSYAFFKDELDKAAPYPGTKNVLFADRLGSSGTEIVLLKKMVTLTTGTYAEGIDAAELSPNGSVIYEITAPYGKIIGNRLSMFCIDRTKPVRYLPTVISGSFPYTARWQLPISATIGTLQSIGSVRDLVQHSGMPALYRLAQVLPRHGYLATPVQIEFLRRVMVPFSFLIFSILSIGFGWSLRPRGKRPSGLLFVLVPLIPYVIYLVETFYLFSGKILFGFLMMLTGFWPALAALLAVQFLFVILSLVYLAGRSTEY